MKQKLTPEEWLRQRTSGNVPEGTPLKELATQLEVAAKKEGVTPEEWLRQRTSGNVPEGTPLKELATQLETMSAF